MKKLNYKELTIGMLVQTKQNEIGTVIEINNECDIHIKFEYGWIEIYCFDTNSKSYEELYEVTK